jgi:hypothetical protein
LQIGKDGCFHLTYCSKIHPGHGWAELMGNLRTYVPPLKARLSPSRPFGLGLRLSAVESQELLERDNLEQLKDFLAQNDLYVFTLNGFPYGSFHGPSVKAEVFAPDWREEARVDYTLRLIDILARLLPPGMEGSISTLPLSYKPWLSPGDAAALERITRNLVGVARVLVQVREAGPLIHLDLEPEPDGLLERSEEVVRFYHDWLLPLGAPLLAEAARMSVSEARARLLTHVQVCLDTCHLAVAWEDPAATLGAYSQKGIRVGKVQITAGLKVALPEGEKARAELTRQIELFARSPYLHQVVARPGGGRQYRDLGEALPLLGKTSETDWRIHFHLPLFVERFGQLCSTQEETRAVLRLLREGNFCRHLEIETYTWEVLPDGLKADLLDSLEREYRWVLQALGV